MATSFIAWSHTRRKAFMDCPKMFYHCNVPKRGHPDKIEFVQSAAMLAGLEIDDALTERVSKGTVLPAKYAPYEGMVSAIIAAPGSKFTQMKLALDQAFKPVGYMEWDAVWVRSIYDIAVINGTHAFIGDYKNGMIWLDEDQLKLFAAVGFHTFPEVETIDTSLIWLRHGLTSDSTYHRRELPDLWAELLPDVERMQASYRAQHWPATPSPRACKWCAVNKQGKCNAAAVKFGG